MYEYPFGNGQQLNLDWFLSEWKNLLAAWEAEKNGIEGALQAEIDRAEAALADIFAARDAAAQSAANALESKNAAAQSATDASGYLATVRADANTAHNAAQNAAQSESNAAESAQTALASKNTAANSERNAAQSEANANSSKNAAAQSASDADASKSAAAQSAADADASKSAAAQSAEDAENAAASVEDSAQQITTNTNDINILKTSIVEESKNLLPNEQHTSTPVNVTVNYENTIVKLNGTSNANGGRLYNISGTKELIAGTYTLSADNLIQQVAVYLQVFGSNAILAQINTANPTSTFTLSETTTIYIGLNFTANYSYNNVELKLQLESGETATPFLKPNQLTAVDYVARAEIAKLQALVLENIGG